MVVSNYHEHISSSPRGLATGVDVESLELSWNTSKPTPCLLVRLTYQATSHHAAAAACVLNKRPCASRRDTPHERARARDEHHSPAMPTAHAFYARDGTRDRGRAGFRVSGRCRRRVVGGRAVVGRVSGASTEEPNGGRHRGGKLKHPVLVFFHVPSVICPGSIRLCPAQNDQKGVRTTTGELGIFLIWVFCRRPQFSRLITIPPIRCSLVEQI